MLQWDFEEVKGAISRVPFRRNDRARFRWRLYNVPAMIRRVWRNLRRAFLRTLRTCGTEAQAVAFNLFLAFFPALLFVLGVLSSSERLSDALQEMLLRLRSLLPPDSRQLVHDYLVGRVQNPWRWIGLGLSGMLLVGLQVMTGMMRGFQLLYRDPRLPAFLSRLWRALVMLTLMLGPWIGAVVLTVFGKQLRGWMIAKFGLPAFFQGLWLVVYVGLALVTAALVLACIYRLGRGVRQSWTQVLPGAVVATLLWWVVNTAFGTYVRKVPYGIVYGGVAAAIGLMIWMNLSVIVVFLGAAYNAEAAEAAAASPPQAAVAGEESTPPEDLL
jgi:membrane protein